MEKKDRRIEKTERAIKNAFIELRAGKPLERITVKELCDLACINKSTFYAHYTDIYELADCMEKETVTSIIRSIAHIEEYTFENSAELTRELCLAFLSQSSLIKVLFSGKEQNHFGNRLDRELKKLIFQKYPDFDTAEKNILLSFCIQGTYHAYLDNPAADTDTFVHAVETIVKRLQSMIS